MNTESSLQLNDIIKNLEKWINDICENNDNLDQDTNIVYQEFKENLLQLYNEKRESDAKIPSLKKLKKQLQSQSQIEKQLMEEYSNLRKLNHDIENETNIIKSEYFSNLINNEINNNDGNNNNNNNNNSNNNTSTFNRNNNIKIPSKDSNTLNNSHNNNHNNNHNNKYNNLDSDKSLLDNLINISNNYNYQANNHNNEYIDNLTETFNISFKKLKKYD